MHNINYPSHKILFGLLCLLIVFASCTNQPADVPLPPGVAGYTQPKSQPLVFTQPKKISWDTTKKGSLQPTIKSFDVNSLPSESYDSSDFIPFSLAPIQASFNFNSLPAKSFNLSVLPAKPLTFKQIYIGNPPRVKAGLPVLKTGSPLSVSSLGAAQGIPGNLTTAIIKDKSGAMWVATNQGVYRYSGDEVQTYIPSLHTLVNCMAQDDEGNIWFLNADGINILNPSSGIVYHSGDIQGKPNDLAYIKQDNTGNFWIVNSATSNLLTINVSKKAYTIIDSTAGLRGPIATDVLQVDAKNIWVSTMGGINMFNLSANTIKYFDKAGGLGADSVLKIAKDSNGHIWATAYTTATGDILKEMDVKNGTIVTYFPTKTREATIQDIALYTFVVSHKNRLWLGTSRGAVVIDPAQKAAKFITSKHGIKGRDVITIAEDGSKKVWIGTARGDLTIIDQDGDLVHPVDNAATNTMIEGPDENIWIGTVGGIKIVDTHKKLIRHFTTQHGLSSNIMQSFSVVDGNMWLASDGGLDIVNQSNKTIEHFGKAEGLANDTVYSFLKATSGDIWFTAPSAGISVLDNKRTIIKHLDISRGLSSDAIADVKEDSQGMIWLANFKTGIDIIDVANGTVKYLHNVPGLADNTSKVLLYDDKGRMWIGTDKGIYIADTKANTLTPITTAEGLPDNKITSLLQRDGKVYAAGSKNVSIITPPGGPNEQWAIEQMENTELLTKEVANTWATNAITKKGQYLWGDSGITIINSLKPYNYSNHTYITGIQINNTQGNFLNLPKNDLPDTLYYQDSFKVKHDIPALEGYKKGDGMNWDTVSGPYNMPTNLHIAYNKNYLQFQFAQVHTTGKTAPVYRYILLGIDKQWSDETTNTFTQNYLNLPPGAYIFKVLSKDFNGKWGQPASFSFTITPPWYKTWWAYTLYILLLTFAIWRFIQYRSRRLVAENQLLEEKVKQRTDALQKSLEELKTTQSQLVQSEKMASLGELTAGIAHEIQNPLNFVNNFAEVSVELAEELKEELEQANIPAASKETVDELVNSLIDNQQKINYHGKRADSIVKGMLQHSRTGSNQKEPTDINNLADEFLRLSYHGLRAKDKSFNATLETNFDTSLPKISIKAQDVGRVLLNMFTNAFYSVMQKKKQLGAGYSPVVSVSTARNGDAIEIRVKDNGLGIPQSVVDKIYNPFFTTKPTGEGTGLGLSLSYDIVVNAHNGSIKVNTKEGEFAEFIINLPFAQTQVK